MLRAAFDVCCRWSQDKTADVQSAVFNGVGHALTWENVWGIWNGVTPRGDAQIARSSAVLRYFQPLMVHPLHAQSAPRPLLHT